MKSILIVDDSATSRLLFKVHMPAGHQYEIHEAHDLKSALEVGAKTHPELVVLDYNMPESNGVDIAKALKASGLNATMVLLTANAQQFVVEDARLAGINLVFEKPITAELIAQLLQE